MKRYLDWVLRHRVAVMAFAMLVTVLAIYQAKNLRIVIDPNTMLPQSHPYISTGVEVEKVFGSKYIVVIGITPREGDIYQPAVLEKVRGMTEAFLQVPGVVRENVLSLSARRAKSITGNVDGLEVKPLLLDVPTTHEQLAALKAAIRANPVYQDAIVSKDGRTTSIIVEFKDGPGGYRAIMDKVAPIVDSARDESVEINVGGAPNFLAHIEANSERMGILLPLAIGVLSLVLFEAFRSRQGLFLPLMTGILAVVWSVGVMGAAGIPMDVFNATTPILILAVATGHAVQMLKRYYEEYFRLRTTTELSPVGANRQAVITSLMRVGPVMIAAGTVASLGFISLIVFDISTVRTFGIFTGIGILATLILEMTFIPALRSMLAPPGDSEFTRNGKRHFWDRITGAIARWVIGPHRIRVYAGAALFVVAALFGMSRVVVDNSMKTYFSPDINLIKDDKALNERLGGTNTVSLLIEGVDDDAIKSPATLAAMDALQGFIEQQTHVGKVISIVDFVKRMNQSMHNNDPAYFRVPESRELVSQYLFLYSISGEPGDFDTYVDYRYRLAHMTVYLKSDSSANFDLLAERINAFAARHFGEGVKVRIGGGLAEGAALSEVMVRGKVLNIVQIVAVVFVIASLLFRSSVAGVLVLLPLLIAVLANFGLIGWAGIPLNISTALISAMAVGIGADYAIYLIYRIREELEAGTDENAAVRTVIASAGKAILSVAVAVAAGYGVLLLSFGFRIHQWLAILIAVAMVVSALAALLLIPALVLSFRPKFIFKRSPRKLSPMPTAVALLAFAFGLAMQAPEVHASPAEAVRIMEKNAVVFKVRDSVSQATFTLTNKSGQERVRKTFSTTKLRDNGTDNMRMTRFLAPADIKGTVSLLIENSAGEDDIWVYLPALKKVRRLVSSNKKDSFVGTDFSYADVIGYKVGEWDYQLMKEDTVDGQACHVVSAVPKDGTVKSNTGYSKRVDWIRKDNFMTVKSEFWDEAGQMLKTASYSDIHLVDSRQGKWQAMRLEANNVQTGHRTVIRVENFKVNQQVTDDFFTTRYMEKE